jgi:hypothetical protein
MWYSAAPASQTTLNDFAANTRAANAARSWAGFPDFRPPTQAEVLTLLHAKDGSLPQQWLPSDAGFGAGWGALPSATPVWSGTVASTTNDACSNAGHQIYWTPTMDTRSSTARLCGTIAGAVGIPVRGTGSERYYLG